MFYMLFNRNRTHNMFENNKKFRFRYMNDHAMSIQIKPTNRLSGVAGENFGRIRNDLIHSDTYFGSSVSGLYPVPAGNYSYFVSRYGWFQLVPDNNVPGIHIFETLEDMRYYVQNENAAVPPEHHAHETVLQFEKKPLDAYLEWVSLVK